MPEFFLNIIIWNKKVILILSHPSPRKVLWYLTENVIEDCFFFQSLVLLKDNRSPSTSSSLAPGQKDKVSNLCPERVRLTNGGREWTGEQKVLLNVVSAYRWIEQDRNTWSLALILLWGSIQLIWDFKVLKVDKVSTWPVFDGDTLVEHCTDWSLAGVGSWWHY